MLNTQHRHWLSAYPSRLFLCVEEALSSYRVGSNLETMQWRFQEAPWLICCVTEDQGAEPFSVTQPLETAASFSATGWGY